MKTERLRLRAPALVLVFAAFLPAYPAGRRPEPAPQTGKSVESPSAPSDPIPGRLQEVPLDGRGGGVIAYSVTSSKDENQIFLVNGDGSGQRKITGVSGRACGPDWSPDGSRIAFYNHFNDQTWSLFVMRADGGDVRRLTNTPSVWDAVPRWSPKGTMIAFSRTYPGDGYRSEIWTVPAAGGFPRRLGAGPGNGPCWSKGGDKILFFAPVGSASEIFEMDADGSRPRPLTHLGAETVWPKYSPDNSRIAFESNMDGDPEIFVMDADGSRINQLTRNGAEDGAPEWSFDGKTIVFVSNRDGRYEIYAIEADGSRPRRITKTSGHAVQPDVKPAGIRNK